jgi:hypothetical protein
MNEFITWSPGTSLEFIEKQAILIAYRFYRGDKAVTAQSLGISVPTLDKKLAEYLEDQKKEEQRRINDQMKREEFLARSRGVASPMPVTSLSPAPVNVQVKGATAKKSGGKAL